MEDKNETICLDSSLNIPQKTHSPEEITSDVGVGRVRSGSSDSEADTDKGTEGELFDDSGSESHQIDEKILGNDCREAEDFFLLLVTDDLLQEIADQTNKYASQLVQQHPPLRLRYWVPTSKNEIKKLFGLLIWMGIFKLPEIDLYWTKDFLFTINFPSIVMPKSRFKLLLRMIRFTDNVAKSDRLDRVKRIVDRLSENFKKYYQVPENVCIDEFIVPFRKRLSFKEYMKQKRLKYGFILFKLCSRNGYTHRFQIYENRHSDAAKLTPTNVVMTLSRDITGKGRTIYVDSWYTSLDLAQQLIRKNTHLVGTIRPNRPGLDKEVIGKKLKRGEVFGKVHKTGIALVKWRGKRNVLVLSTKHAFDVINLRVKVRKFAKPAFIVDYNDNKFSEDVSDQMTAYCSPLRETLNWYQKLGFELLLNTAVVNAWILYNAKKKTPTSLLQYKKKLILYLCDVRGDFQSEDDASVWRFRKLHELHVNESVPPKRYRCRVCYKQHVKSHSSKDARNMTKKVKTFCSDCPNNPYLCIPCFNRVHRFMKM